MPSSRSGRSSANIIYKLFNSALEDVLTKGGQSKYYNAFKELNPEVGLYNAGSDDIDTLIFTREYTNTPEYQAMTQQNRPSLAQKAINKVDEVYTKAINTNAVNRLEKSLTEAMNGGTKGDTKFVRPTKETLNDINQVRQAQGMNPLTKRQVTAYEGAVNGHLTKHIKQGHYKNSREAAQAAFDILTSPDGKILKTDQSGIRHNTKNTLVALDQDGVRSDSVSIANASDGGTSLKDITPRTTNWVNKQNKATNSMLQKSSQVGDSSPTSLPTYDSVAGPSISGRLTANTNSVSQNPTNVKQNQSKFSTDTATRSQELSDDFRARENIELALQNYRGAILAATHDETFAENVGFERTIPL